MQENRHIVSISSYISSYAIYQRANPIDATRDDMTVFSWKTIMYARAK